MSNAASNCQPLWCVGVSFAWMLFGYFALVGELWKVAAMFAVASHLMMMLACAVIIAQGRIPTEKKD